MPTIVTNIISGAEVVNASSLGVQALFDQVQQNIILLQSEEANASGKTRSEVKDGVLLIYKDSEDSGR